MGMAQKPQISKKKKKKMLNYVQNHVYNQDIILNNKETSIKCFPNLFLKLYVLSKRKLGGVLGNGFDA